MHPVQHFRANFARDEIIETASDSLTGKAVGSSELHETGSTVRNLCFLWEDGRRAFFNYAYLVSVDLAVADNLNVMMLYFSEQIVTLKGYLLEGLFNLLLDHSVKTILTNNLRYYTLTKANTFCVTNISVKGE